MPDLPWDIGADGCVDPLTNAEGWFQTKDKGQWLDDELVIQGRLDNMFISGGENIQPEEIEKVIAQSDLVKQVFVLPKHDEEFGHRPVAIVEFHTSFNESAVESLNVFLQGRLERFKQPIAYYELPTEFNPRGNKDFSQSTGRLAVATIGKLV